MEQKKKATNAQLKAKIDHALVFVEKTKVTKQAFFFDKMVMLAASGQYAVVKTGYHRHVFDALNPNQGGYARPYIYTLKVLDIVEKHKGACWDDKQKGYSYDALLTHLEKQEDKSEYYLAYFYSMWLYIIFHNLYSLDVSKQSTFLVYFKYLEMIACNHVIASVAGPHEEDVTNKDFVDKYIKLLKEMTDEMEEKIVFDKIDEEAALRDEISAMEEADKEQMEQQEETNDGTT